MDIHEPGVGGCHSASILSAVELRLFVIISVLWISCLFSLALSFYHNWQVDKFSCEASQGKRSVRGVEGITASSRRSSTAFPLFGLFSLIYLAFIFRDSLQQHSRFPNNPAFSLLIRIHLFLYSYYLTRKMKKGGQSSIEKKGI